MTHPSPRPGPGFLGLVGLHIQALWREFPLAWVALGGLAVALPIMSVLYGQDPVDPSQMMEPTGIVLLSTVLLPALLILTLVTAFLWPEAVWRNLGPGSRVVMDASPVSRRSHRMARVVAGLPLLVGVSLSVGASSAILRSNPELVAMNVPTLGLGAVGSGLPGFGVALLSLVTAYLFGSALALRIGRVFIPLLLLFLGLNVVMFAAITTSWDVGTELGQRLVQGHWSLLRALLVAPNADTADLAPVLAWLLVMLGLCMHWAHRHDRG
ncbi:MAG: hypothetical protein EA352_09145 [Gemmatimonadales bacterium]|nr:MAG: hypothetical protein EA352_09145 [Gemmatimonadales bacterium]